MDRPTPDLIVLALSMIVVLVVLIMLLSAALIELIQPQTDTSTLMRWVVNITASSLTGVIGYVSGRLVTQKGDY